MEEIGNVGKWPIADDFMDKFLWLSWKQKKIEFSIDFRKLA